jgi:hypothetical protein
VAELKSRPDAGCLLVRLVKVSGSSYIMTSGPLRQLKEADGAKRTMRNDLISRKYWRRNVGRGEETLRDREERTSGQPRPTWKANAFTEPPLSLLLHTPQIQLLN